MTTARLVAATGLTIAALAAHAPAQAQTRPEERACAALAGWSAGPEDLTITEARFYANRTIAARPGAEMTLPPHCHVAGSFERRTGVDGKAIRDRFRDQHAGQLERAVHVPGRRGVERRDPRAGRVTGDR